MLRYLIYILLYFPKFANSQTIIPIEKNNGVYYISCSVNDLRLKFIFDTGAGDVSISLSEANFMIKNGYILPEDIIGTEYYRIANGDIAEGTRINIRKLQIGNKTLYNVSASIIHTLSAPLLLGQSAIERFGKFSLDYTTMTLTFGDGSPVQINVNPQKANYNNISIKNNNSTPDREIPNRKLSKAAEKKYHPKASKKALIELPPLDASYKPHKSLIDSISNYRYQLIAEAKKMNYTSKIPIKNGNYEVFFLCDYLNYNKATVSIKDRKIIKIKINKFSQPVSDSFITLKNNPEVTNAAQRIILIDSYLEGYIFWHFGYNEIK